MQHAIKCKPEHFEPLIAGIKTAEIRENDRDYQVGDTLLIREFGPQGYTRRDTVRTVTHVLTDYMPQGWVCLSVSP